MQESSAAIVDHPILTGEQEAAVLELQQRLDGLDTQRDRLGGNRAVLRWLAALGLIGPFISVVAGGRRRAQLIAEVGEVGVVLAIVAFVAAVLWLVHDHWRGKWLSREIDSHDQALRLLGLIYCGRTGYGSEPSYFVWRSDGQRWVAGKAAIESVVRNGTVSHRAIGTKAPLLADTPGQVVLSLPLEEQDVARSVLEALAACIRDRDSLGGWRAVLRRSLVAVLPFGLYWMSQDPQYSTVTRLFGDAPFGVLPMVWIASLAWLVADERKARALSRRRRSIQERLKELGVVSVSVSRAIAATRTLS